MTYRKLLVAVLDIGKSTVLNCNLVIASFDGNDTKFDTKLSLNLLKILW